MAVCLCLGSCHTCKCRSIHGALFMQCAGILLCLRVVKLRLLPQVLFLFLPLPLLVLLLLLLALLLVFLLCNAAHGLVLPLHV